MKIHVQIYINKSANMSVYSGREGTFHMIHLELTCKGNFIWMLISNQKAKLGFY